MTTFACYTRKNNSSPTNNGNPYLTQVNTCMSWRHSGNLRTTWQKSWTHQHESRHLWKTPNMLLLNDQYKQLSRTIKPTCGPSETKCVRKGNYLAGFRVLRYLYNAIIYNLFLSCWESCLGHFQGFSILLITHVQASVYEMSIFYDKKQFIRFLVFLIPTFWNNFLEPKFNHAFSIVAHQVTQNSHTMLALESKKVLFYLFVYFRLN